MVLHKLHKCKDCPSSFNSEYGLIFHTNNLHNNKCDLCERIFKSKHLMMNHIYNVHKSLPKVKAEKKENYLKNQIENPNTEEKIKFECEVCDKQFSSKYSFLAHEKIVHDEKKSRSRMKCHQCQLEFVCSSGD